MPFETGKSYTHDTHGYQIYIKRVEDPPEDPTVVILVQSLPGPLVNCGSKVFTPIAESDLVFDDWTEVT